VTSRVKSIYSINEKMKKRGVLRVSDIHDINAIRIITKSTDTIDCYKIFAIIQSNYNTIPGLIKDYISNPKLNGYRSIHTIIAQVNENTIEIQIRNEEMHRIAEFGPAAHWKYKSSSPFNEKLQELLYSHIHQPRDENKIRIIIHAKDRSSLLLDYSQIITPRCNRIDSIKSETRNDQSTFTYDIIVSEEEQLEKMIHALEQEKDIRTLKYFNL
jgi:(p)ppGpp synthase/HD superfamily hydrolase